MSERPSDGAGAPGVAGRDPAAVGALAPSHLKLEAWVYGSVLALIVGWLLYIGKGVNMRARVQSHFAADHSAGRAMRIAQETKRIEWIETAGELEAPAATDAPSETATAQPPDDEERRRAYRLNKVLGATLTSLNGDS